MRACVVVFGREPASGRVKTRLARSIGAKRAAAVYRNLLERTLAEAAGTGLPVVLSLAEEPAGIWEPPSGLLLEVQGPGDLGSRMLEAFSRRFSEGMDRVLLIGSDCPGLTSATLLESVALLDRVPVVLGPARDGGYWAIGQQKPGTDCFSGVPWSSPRTLEITRRRLRDLGVSWAETVTLADVDTLEDLQRWDTRKELGQDPVS